MPTKQKRHTCALCGCKRVEKYMFSLFDDKFGIRKKNIWFCNGALLVVNINHFGNCSKRTPQEQKEEFFKRNKLE